MLANNETGVLQPLAEVRDLLQRAAPGTALFTDAVQAATFVELPRAAADVDLGRARQRTRWG